MNSTCKIIALVKGVFICDYFVLLDFVKKGTNTFFGGISFDNLSLSERSSSTFYDISLGNFVISHWRPCKFVVCKVIEV